jgi:hypothetical protein
MRVFGFVAAIALAWFASFQPAAAQRIQTPAGQALAECLTRSASEADGVTLMRWIFVAMARHPSVSNFATIPDSERVAINRATGDLFGRLLLDDCPAQTRAAFQADGSTALEAPFAALGEIAMTGIMNHADVNAATAEMGSYVDGERLSRLLE